MEVLIQDRSRRDATAACASDNGINTVHEPSEPRSILKRLMAAEADRFSRRDVLKVGAAGALGSLVALPGNSPGRAAEGQTLGPIKLVFDEPVDRPAGKVRWPVTVGVPFADGALARVDDLALSTGDAPEPAQFAAALDWRFGAKTISWVHCDFQAELGQAAPPAVQLAVGKAAPAPQPAVVITDAGDHFKVDTGVISFTCGKRNFGLFDSFVAGDQAVVRASALYWQDTQGNVYEARHAESTVTIEKSGPLRGVLRYDGWYQSAQGARKLRYSVWLHVFAGLPYVRLYNKLIWTENLTLYVAIDTTRGELTTKSLYADRNGVDTVIAHGWSTGDAVRFAYSHSDVDSKGRNQYFDNTSAQGDAVVRLPQVKGTALDRGTDYFVRVTSPTSFTLHRTPAEAREGRATLEFLDQGRFSERGVDYGGRHYLQAQYPVLAEWGLKLHLAQPAQRAEIGLTGAAQSARFDLTQAKNVAAHQSAHGTATIKPQVGEATHVHSLAGWGAATFAGGGGLAVAVKGLSQQVPKILEVDAATVTIKLWGGTPMSLREEDRVLPGFRKNGYQKEWLAFSGEPNPVGISKTHEVWIWPVQDAAALPLVNDLVQRPVACCADPNYACQTDYIAGLRPRNLGEKYAFVEEALENMMHFVTARDSAHGDFDEWNFGDLRLFRNGSFRTWDNGGYNCADIFWWQWYRTGKRFFLEEGLHNARHVMDVDTMAHSQTVSGGYNNYLRIAGRTHNYATLHWAWPVANADLYVDHPAYLLLCWLMTGYEVARDVLETKVQERRGAGYGDPGSLTSYNPATVTREQYGAILPKFIYHEFTGDPQFYNAGRKWLQLAMNAQAASKETNANGTRLFPNNNFWGYFYEGFLYAYRYAGEANVLTALAQTIDDFARAPTGYFDAQNFQCSWPAPSRLGRTRYSLIRFTTAYRKTKDLQYLQYPVDKIMRQCRTIQSSGPLRGFDTIEGILTPGFLRDSLMLLGTLADAGVPAIRWPGNIPFFGSRAIATAPWASQITLWVQKKAGAASTIKLVFKDANLTPLEAPGRVQAVVLDPAGKPNTVLLSKEASYAAKLIKGQLTLAAGANFSNGQAVRFRTKGKLPAPLAAGTTYYARVAGTSPATTLTIHGNHGDAIAGVNALALSAGSGDLELLSSGTLHEATFTLPAASPAGAYRIHIQSESQLFRVYPSSDAPGFVVELPGLSDLSLDGTLGPAEYHLRLRPGHSSLRLSTTQQKCHLVQPLVVMDLERNRLGAFEYDLGKTLASEISIPAPHVSHLLKLAKGYEEYSPPTVDSLPAVRLGGAERYIAIEPAQWFNPLAAFNNVVAGFWSMEEPSGVRHDATGKLRNLQEQHGTVEHDPDSRHGMAALFSPTSNAYLAVTDPIFVAPQGFTVWGWVRLDQFAEARYLFVKGGDVHGNPSSCEWAIYALPTPSGRLFFQARVGKRFAFTPGVPWEVDGKTHFVIAWYDAREQKIFLQVDSGSIVSQALGGPINAGQEPFCVGGSAPNQRGWVGTITAVGFARAPLTELQRNLLYNGGAGLQYPF